MWHYNIDYWRNQYDRKCVLKIDVDHNTSISLDMKGTNVSFMLRNPKYLELDMIMEQRISIIVMTSPN